MRARLSRLLGSASARDAAPVAAGAAERVRPQLADLTALSRRAAGLPGWQDRSRARQSGVYHAAMKGRGMEYAESRPYQPGDDVRALDWRLTARSGRPHTKLFREERERPVLLCVDFRAPMFFATRGVFKVVQAARAAALLAWRAQQNGDRLGGLLFADDEHHELPPRRGRAATLRWLKLLTDSAPRLRTAPPVATPAPLAAAFTRLARVAKPGTLIFVISDFRGFDDDARAALARLGQHADLGLILVHDPLEAAFPALDEAATIASGARRLRLAGVSAGQRERYAAQFDARVAAVRGLCREQGLLFASLDTGADPVAALMRMFGG